MAIRNKEDFNKLMEALKEQWDLKDSGNPELHFNQFRKQVALLFGGRDNMVSNIIKTLILCGYLEETTAIQVFKIKTFHL